MGTERSARLARWAWFVALWAAGVLVMGAIVGALRLAIGWAS